MANKRDSFSNLTALLKRDARTKVYIDTCSLYVAVREGCTFFDRLVPLLQETNCKFDITHGTLEEIKAHRAGPDPKLASTAARLEKLLAVMGKGDKRLNLVELVGKPGEYHDEAIQAKIRERARSFNQVYITNDLANAWDVYRIIIDSASVEKGLKRLLIYRITRSGDLVFPVQLPFLRKMSADEVTGFFSLWNEKRYAEAEDYLTKRTGYRSSHLQSGEAIGPSDSVRSQRVPESLPRYAPLKASLVVNPRVGVAKAEDELVALRGAESVPVTLGNRVARGGEGFVFEAALGGGEVGPFLAKVYRRSRLRDVESACELMQKVCHIVASRFGERRCQRAVGLLGDLVAFPLYVLANGQGEFIGYLMRRAPGSPLSHMVADGAVKSEFLRLHPDVTKIDLVDICLAFLTAMRELHATGIVAGDLNTSNVLVGRGDSGWDVTIIDADSFQYGEAYPCDVAIKKYTAPELLDGRGGRFMTQQNELFVVARILFETLMLVDNPYNSAVAEDPVEDMRNGRFRYTFEFAGSGGERLSNREAPGEYYEIKWGQLTRGIKNALGNTFHCDGAYWQPGGRCSIDKWIHLLRDYRAELVQSVQSGSDVVSNEAYPTTRRKWVTRFHCEVCGQDGVQEVEPFRSIVFPEIAGDDLLSTARRFHFRCYCECYGLRKVCCSKCGAEMGYGMPTRSDGKDYICQSCWERVKCVSCHTPTPKWMLDEHGVCGKCRSKQSVTCKSCGKSAPRWLIDRNGGVCDDCKLGVPTYCDCCGSYMGRLRPRADGKKQFCEKCWQPAKCACCGWDNDGKASRWMFDSRGYCRKCADRERKAGKRSAPTNRKPQAVRQRQTSTQKPQTRQAVSGTPAQKHPLFDRLFGRRKEN